MATAPNVRVAAGSVHRARGTYDLLGITTTLCGRTLQRATVTDQWVSCGSCRRPAGA